MVANRWEMASKVNSIKDAMFVLQHTQERKFYDKFGAEGLVKLGYLSKDEDKSHSLNAFEVLETHFFASDEEIKKAYKRVVSKYHPDKNLTHFEEKDIKFLEKVTQHINASYELLKDEKSRQKYKDNLSFGDFYDGKLPFR